MTPEPAPEPEYRWINNKRQGRCAVCDHMIQQGSRTLWSLLDKRHIYCAECAARFGHTDPYPEGEGKGTVGDRNEVANPLPQTSHTYSIGGVAERTTTTESLSRQSRENAIALAHTENIAASTALTTTLKDLVEVLRQINYQLTVRP